MKVMFCKKQTKKELVKLLTAEQEKEKCLWYSTQNYGDLKVLWSKWKVEGEEKLRLKIHRLFLPIAGQGWGYQDISFNSEETRYFKMITCLKS